MKYFDKNGYFLVASHFACLHSAEYMPLKWQYMVGNKSYLAKNSYLTNDADPATSVSVVGSYPQPSSSTNARCVL